MIPGIEILEQTIILFLESLFGMVGWFGVVLAMAIESACIPLPSEVTMPLAGWFLIEARGYPVWHVIWAGLYGGLGCTIGSGWPIAGSIAGARQRRFSPACCPSCARLFRSRQAWRG